jgi:hypothetical protein
VAEKFQTGLERPPLHAMHHEGELKVCLTVRTSGSRHREPTRWQVERTRAANQ